MPHLPVLLKEVIEYLNPQPNQNFVDCTLGDGGHAKAILERTAPKGKILGIDLDPKAIKIAQIQNSKSEIRNRLIAVEDNFKNLKKIVSDYKFGPVHGVLLDLGFRSEQLEEKGISFLRHEVLDMRFGPKSGELIGKEIVNTWNESELIKIFKIYGEEKNAIGIAKEIIRRRKIKPIVYSDELAEIVLQFYREKFKTKKRIPWVGGRHPATKIFQAIRIAVNDEINNLKSVLPQAIDILEKDGRLCVISFHSLEDRIVKKFFKQMSVACDFGAGKLKILTKKPIRPSEEEIQQNPRSRSARLRVAQKL